MSAQTGIEWCDSTANFWMGCTAISPACDHCYAEARMDKRLHRVEWGAGKPRVRLLHWIIVGGESGTRARPMHPDWVRSLRDQCAAAGVPFLFKQWGDWEHVACVEDSRQLPSDKLRYSPDLDATFYRRGKAAAGRLLDGCEHNAFPESH